MRTIRLKVRDGFQSFQDRCTLEHLVKKSDSWAEMFSKAPFVNIFLGYVVYNKTIETPQSLQVNAIPKVSCGTTCH